jgi:hypothetical protein
MGYGSLEHWLEDPQHVCVGHNVVYVARTRQHEFVNGFSVKKHGRDECLRMYETWLTEAILDDDVRARFENLRNKTTSNLRLDVGAGAGCTMRATQT